MAVFSFVLYSPPAAEAQSCSFKHDYLYKFSSRWSDVTTDGGFLYVTNSNYSQIEKYTVGGVYNNLYGGAGSGLGQLKQPMGIAIGTANPPNFNLYVADTGNGRIEQFDAVSLGYLDAWGTAGSGDSQMDNPQGVAVNEEETYVFVADTGNNRIQALDLSSGTFYAHGSLGDGNDQFSSPKGIAVYGTGTDLIVYVADTGNNRIAYYTFNTVSHTFTFNNTFGSYGTTSSVSTIGFSQPNKITVDKSTPVHVYVTDSTNRIQRFDTGGNFQAQWNVHSLLGTTGITSYTSGGIPTVYVVEPNNQIDSYNGQTTVYGSNFYNEENQPVDIALDSDGNIFINNDKTDTVTKFTSSWVPIMEWGEAAPPYSGAKGIGVNTGGEVVVADTGNDRVIRYDKFGVNPTELPTPMVTPVGFNGPKDVGIENIGGMVVADTDNNRVLRYNYDNTPDWSIGLPTPTFTLPGPGTPTPTTPAGAFFLQPYGVAIDSQHKIYIADTGHHRIMKFNNQGVFDTTDSKGWWGEYGGADNLTEPQFRNPQGVAIEETGTLGSYYLYVVDTGNSRIQRFSQSGAKVPECDVWGEFGTQDSTKTKTYFNEPRNIAVDYATPALRHIYVSEVQNRRIQAFGDAQLNAGLQVVETGNTAVTEDGSVLDSYTVRLLTQPMSNVSISVVSSDSAQLTVATPLLTFTPQNWNVPQVVTVKPVHDYVDQPDTQHILISNIASSSDSNYQSNGVSLVDVNVTLTDTDTAGVNVAPAGVDVWEDGSNLVPAQPESETYSVTLASKPANNADVTITAASSNGYTTVSPPSYVIHAADWQTPVDFTITAVHDYVANGDHSDFITNTVTSTDPIYNGMSASQVLASVHDTVDQAGVNISTNAVGPIDEAGTPGSYTLVLNSKPTANVTINIATPAGTTDIALNPTSVMFTPANWNTVQTVSLQAMQDFIYNSSDRNVDVTNTSSSLDANYSGGVQFRILGVNASNIVATTIRNIDELGVAFVALDGNVNPDDGLRIITEGQEIHHYSMALRTKPSGNVLLTTSSDSEATTSGYIHTFTPANWNVPQIVTVTTPNNSVYEGTHEATLTHTIEHSADPNYPESPPASFNYQFWITDTDEPGLEFTLPNGAINIQEGGADDQYYMHLKTRPLADVTVNISGGSDATVTPSSLTFTAANWQTDQIATVSAINNFIVQNAHTGTLTHTMSSADTGYNGLKEYLTMNIADDDNTVPGVQITQSNGSTEVWEAGAGDSYTLQLTSRPTANVRIRVLSNNWEATTSAALFTFTPNNWNVPQTVNVVAKDDPALDGDQTSVFRHILTSLDLMYNYLSVDDVNVIAHDNDHTSPATAPTCGKTPPADTPNLFQIDAAANSATLYFTPIKDNIDYYFIAYGYKPGDIRFGVSFPFGPYDGVIDYTVNMLNSGTTYYYKVRGGNGCATGNWSNTLAATTTASGSASIRSYYGGGTSGYASTGGSYSGGAITGGVSADGTHPIFIRDLYPGSRGADVRSLQIYLNQKGFIVAQSGAGSPGNETDYYGPLTASAVRRFQEAHYAEILSPLGYSSGTGIFGPSTRAYVNAN